MSSDAAPKLTKKQRKSVAFRERKTKKGGKPVAADLPELEDQDAAELELDTEPQTPVEPKPKLDKKGKGKATPAPQAVAEDATAAPSSSATKSSKRKRDPAAADEGADAQTDAKPAKVTKKQKTEAQSTEEGDTRRKILFLGNLKYTTTKEEIAKHFAECDPPPSIRLLTPKAKPGAPVNKAIKSKGCAFLEFSQKNSLQQGLRLHHSVLDGRQINVELTAGGGGNSTTRLTKLKERNKELHGQRTKAAEKRKTGPKQPEDKAEEIAQLIAGKRFSATSGVEEAPKVQRTWTVGDVQEETTHRGGVKHKKSDRQRGAKKSQASGMNAIPVG